VTRRHHEIVRPILTTQANHARCRADRFLPLRPNISNSNVAHILGLRLSHSNNHSRMYLLASIR
jgi:hypothetical protein